jgi:hypothetical protein
MAAFINSMVAISNKHLKAPNREIEIRIGKITPHGFDTNIGVDMYNRLTLALNQYTGWESLKMKKEEIFYGQNGLRSIYDEEKEVEVSCIHKTRVEHKDFHLEPYDVRLSIADEKPYKRTESDEFTHSKKRLRFSYIRKNLSIDLSMIVGEPADKDNESLFEYQIELEIIDPSKVENDSKLYNILYKTCDVLKLMI